MSQTSAQPSTQQSPTDTAGIGFSVAAIVCGVIAVLFLPIVLGPVAIILAGVSKSRHERLANVALGVAIAGTAVGLILGVIVGVQMFANR